jgi:hypothetical protein
MERARAGRAWKRSGTTHLSTMLAYSRPEQSFILDDTGMRQQLYEVDLLHKLRNFLLLEAIKPDPHSDHLLSTR